MKKANMDSLLRLLADYRSFCDQSQDCVARPVVGNSELSENELELVSAAAQAAPPMNKKTENP